MKKIKLIKIGLIPLAFGILFTLINLLTQNQVLFGLLSVGFLILWGYTGYDVGKVSNSFLQDLTISHLIPIVILIIQIMGIFYMEMSNTYNPVLIGQLYFLPIANLILNLFVMTVDKAIIISFIIMIIVFSIGMYSSKAINKRGK